MNKLESIQSVKDFIGQKGLNLLYVSTFTCTVCGALQPKVVRFLEDYPEVASAEVVLENVPAIAGELLVMSAPSVLIFCDGKELHRIMKHSRRSCCGWMHSRLGTTNSARNRSSDN